MNRISYILIFIFIVFGCKNSISKEDQDRASEYYKTAVDFRINGDLENAKLNYAQALEIDKANTAILFELIGVYVEQDSLESAFELLDLTPKDMKESPSFYQMKGSLHEFEGEKEMAIDNYKKALELTDSIIVQDEKDLSPLINYATLETVAGNKTQALNRLNKTLELEWMTESNKENLEIFRNEIEYYQGEGALDLDPKRDILILTTRPDSLEVVLKENHINITGSGFGGRNDTTEIYLSEKYRIGLDRLNIKTHPNKTF